MIPKVLFCLSPAIVCSGKMLFQNEQKIIDIYINQQIVKGTERDIEYENNLTDENSPPQTLTQKKNQEPEEN